MLIICVIQLYFLCLRETSASQGVLLHRDNSDIAWSWSNAFTLGDGIGPIRVLGSRSGSKDDRITPEADAASPFEPPFPSMLGKADIPPLDPRWKRDVSSGSYSVCDLAFTQTNSTNSWQVSEFIQSQDAIEVTIKFVFTARQCPGGYAYCVQYFNLFTLETDDQYESMNESVIRDDFRFVQKVLASSVWTSLVTPVSNAINVTMITQRKGFYLALKDVGACVAVSGISVTYNYCPSSVINGVTYPRTVSLALRDGVTQVEGNCSTMAVQYPYNRTLVANCSASGDWQVLESNSTCMCKAGFGLLGDKCKACQNGEYKNIVGNSGCITCPGHTHSSVLRDVCICDAGFYRASVDSPLGPCYGPPSEPRNLSYTTIATGVIMVTWLQPIDTGSRSDVTYDISCHKCLAGACADTCADVILWPSNQGLLNTHLIATLGASGDIGDVKITVFAKNGVSDLAGLGKARNGSIVLSTLGTTLSPTGTSTGRAAGNGTGTTAWVPTGAGSADTSRQVAIAIGVTFTVTLIVCIALASALIWYLRNKWRPKVINLAHLSSERTGHNGEDTFHDNSSTETDLTDSFKIWQNAQNNLSPKINAMRMYRRNSTEPLTVNKDGERESREAWTPLQGKKTVFTGLFTNNRLGSSVTVKSWFPEPQVQYDV